MKTVQEILDETLKEDLKVSFEIKDRCISIENNCSAIQRLIIASILVKSVLPTVDEKTISIIMKTIIKNSEENKKE